MNTPDNTVKQRLAILLRIAALPLPYAARKVDRAWGVLYVKHGRAPTRHELTDFLKDRLPIPESPRDLMTALRELDEGMNLTCNVIDNHPGIAAWIDVLMHEMMGRRALMADDRDAKVELMASADLEMIWVSMSQEQRRALATSIADDVEALKHEPCAA